MSVPQKLQHLADELAKKSKVERTVKCAHVVTALAGLEALRRKIIAE
jgi:hypothetical protein